MTTTSFKVFVYSPYLEILDEIRRETCLDAIIIQDGELQKVCVLSITETNNYIIDNVILLIVNTIHKLYSQLPNQVEKKIWFSFDIEIAVADADETSIPGILFPAEYISFVSEHRIQTMFHLMISSSTKKGHLNSGAYLYITSNNTIDVSEINRITGTSPSVVYQKGRSGRYTIVNFNAWGLEVTAENRLPDYPALMLMRKLKNAKEVGLYCKENNLESHMDITCYSIPSEPFYFQLEPSFFSFLKELNVSYINIDFMN